MNLELILLPEKGIGNLTFGMPIDDVIAFLGEATDLENVQDNDEGLNFTELYYEDYNLSLIFENNDGVLRLNDIVIESNENATLFGAKVFELDKAQLINLMKENGHTEYEEDTDEELEEDYVTYDNIMMDFYFNGNELVSVNYSVLDF